jgi:PleD family two-component response regulator
MYQPTESLPGRVSQQLYYLEKRDWETRTLVSVTGILLTGSIRGCDNTVRYGGDAFLALLAGTTAGGARSVAVGIASNLAAWNAGRHFEDFTFSVSIGAAEWHDGQTLDEGLDVADRRCITTRRPPKLAHRQ